MIRVKRKRNCVLWPKKRLFLKFVIKPFRFLDPLEFTQEHECGIRWHHTIPPFITVRPVMVNGQPSNLPHTHSPHTLIHTRYETEYSDTLPQFPPGHPFIEHRPVQVAPRCHPSYVVAFFTLRAEMEQCDLFREWPIYGISRFIFRPSKKSWLRRKTNQEDLPTPRQFW